MHTFVSLSFVLLLLMGSARAAVPAYEILDLGPLATPFEDGVFLNDHGQTVFNNPSGAFRYTDGIGGEVIANGWVGGINNHGQVSLLASENGTPVVARYTDGVGVEPLVRPVGYTNLCGPNNRGDIAFGDESGVSYVSDEGVTFVGGLFWPFSDYAYARDMNDSGMVLYGFVSAASTGTYWIYTHPNGSVDARPMTWVSGLNNRGDMIGFVGYREAAIRWAGGSVEKIGLLNDYDTAGVDLNDHGMAIGIGRSGSSQIAWVMTPNGLADLNTLIDPELGWRLTQPTSINNIGQIAGTGFVNGERHAFRLTPKAIPEPGTLALVVLGFLPLMRRSPFQARTA